MGNQYDGVPWNRMITRRGVIRSAAGGAALGGIARGAAAAPGTGSGSVARGQGDKIVFISSQLTPIQEAEKMRNNILKGFSGSVDFVPEDPGPFTDRIQSEAKAGKGTVSLVGGLHGDFDVFVKQDLLTDLSDLAEKLKDRGFVPDFLKLGQFGTDKVYYIPWMQASYIMCAHKDALDALPSGLTEETLKTGLTYDQLTAWGKNLNDKNGQVLGFPAGEKGLLHRFFQGYGYPSFTGGLNTTFKSADAVKQWEWFKSTWAYTNPQALSFDNMDVPLQSGTVMVAWDHTARLINALTDSPDDFVTFPAPRGPKGLGYMPVVAGLAIPKTAPNVEGAKSLIDYLTTPETQTTTLEQVAFFPVVKVTGSTSLPPGTQKEADAVQQTTDDPKGIPSLLPVGLGEQNGAYNKVFQDSFRSIVVDGKEIQPVLNEQATNLQKVLDTVKAACWPPDPASQGTCQVG